MLIGSGGREHAIARKSVENLSVEKIFCAPGNGGTAVENKCENVNLNSIDEYLNFAKENKIELTIVGPEAPLVDGVVDAFKKEGLRVFGPHREAAKLEGSKSFAKDFMKKYNIKTAEYETFTDIEKAKDYIKECKYPVVVKADGLAAGKGVIICNTYDEALNALEDLMVKDVFKGAGSKIVIEEFLKGVEASILSVTDGNTIVPFLSSKDHKQIFDNDEGPNTGGMGVIAPNPYCTESVLESFERDIMNTTLEGLREENLKFNGFIFFGLMICGEDVYLLEYNIRMGDPETQAVLALMEDDFVNIIESCLDGKLEGKEVNWKKGHACVVIGASEGYPGSYKKGLEINNYIENKDKVIIAGAKYENNKLITSGGRVLAAVELGDTLEEAREKAYSVLEKVDFQGMYFRKDIGKVK